MSLAMCAYIHRQTADTNENKHTITWRKQHILTSINEYVPFECPNHHPLDVEMGPFQQCELDLGLRKFRCIIEAAIDLIHPGLSMVYCEQRN